MRNPDHDSRQQPDSIDIVRELLERCLVAWLGLDEVANIAFTLALQGKMLDVKGQQNGSLSESVAARLRPCMRATHGA